MVDILLVLTVACSTWQTNAQPTELCYEHEQSPLPVAVYTHQAIYSALRSAVYLFGGYSAESTAYHDVYKWDVSQPNSWFVRIGSVSSNTNQFWSYGNQAVMVGTDKVYFMGIYDSSGFIPHVYDLVSESWDTPSNVAQPPDAVALGCVARSDTHIYMVGGTDETMNFRSPLIYVYDIHNDEWTSVPLGFALSDMDIRGGWNSQYCAVVSNRLYIFGGDTTGQGPVNLVSDAYRMDLATISIQRLPYMPQAQAFGTAVYHQGKIHLVGGWLSESVYTSDIVAFDISLETYSVAYDAGAAFDAAGVLSLDGLLYIFGGAIDLWTPTDLVRVCVLPTTSKPTSNPTNAPTTLHPSVLPSLQPNHAPTNNPSSSPSEEPTDEPTSAATSVQPSSAPSQPPSFPSTVAPTKAPTLEATTMWTSVHVKSSSSTSSAFTPTIIIIIICAAVVFVGCICLAACAIYYVRTKGDQRRLSENVELEQARPEESNARQVDIPRVNVELQSAVLRVIADANHAIDNAHVEDTRGEDNLSLPAVESVLCQEEGNHQNEGRRQSQQVGMEQSVVEERGNTNDTPYIR